MLLLVCVTGCVFVLAPSEVDALAAPSEIDALAAPSEVDALAAPSEIDALAAPSEILPSLLRSKRYFYGALVVLSVHL